MKDKKQKILFFATEDWFVCSHWLPIIAGAINAGYEVVVVTRVNKYGEKIIQCGARLIPFDMSRRGKNVFSELNTIFRLMQIYREVRPDIAHHVAMKPMLYGSLCSHLVRIPHTVNWVAGMGWLFISSSKQAKLLQLIVRKVLNVLLSHTYVIVENKDDQAVMEEIGVSAGFLRLIRGAGVDTLSFATSSESESIPLVVLPARMLFDKGVAEFVEAATILKNRGVSARFALVGEPDAQNPASVTEHQLNAWNKMGAVEWWGRREDMPEILKMSHIVCLPSYREGLPKALLEAASCSRPIVTTDVPGCREVVYEGENGYLVEVRNSEALADALYKLLIDKELRQRMGQSGRTRVIKEFSRELVVEKVLAIYREALE